VTPGEARAVHLAVLAVGGSGLVYAWMQWCLHPVDEFALVNHPWQPTVQHLHVLLAPTLVFAIGLVWNGHVLPRLRDRGRNRRRTGLLLVGATLPMVLSGYLVQVCSDEGWRRICGIAHGAVSLLWVSAYLAHQLALRRPVAGPEVVGREHQPPSPSANRGRQRPASLPRQPTTG
jgi:hypothetical protein